MARILRYGLYAVTAGLVAAAVLLSAVRFWLLPKAGEWGGEVQSTVSAMIGQTVQIKSFSAEMRGFRPEITIRGFRMDNPSNANAPIVFERLGVGLDMVPTLLQRKPVVNYINLYGAKVQFSRNADGNVALMGLGPKDAPLWLLAVGEVRFTDIDLVWDGGEGGQNMALGRAQIRLRNAGAEHSLHGRVDLPGKLGKAVKFSAEIQGNPLQSDDWQGRAYAEVKRLREGAFVESLPVRMRSGEAGGQLWMQWQGGGLQTVMARLDLDRPTFAWRRSDGAEGLLSLDKLGGWLRWQQEDGGWRMDAKKLALSYKGRAWPETDFAVALAKGGDDSLQVLRLAVNYLRLEETQALLETVFPLFDQNFRDTLRAYSPKGELRDASLVYQADGHVGFCGKVESLTFTPPPGWSNWGRINGRICGNDQSGEMDVHTQQTVIDAPGFWQQPLALDELGGSFQWLRQGAAGWPWLPAVAGDPALQPGSAWHVVGNGFTFAAPGIKGSGGFLLELPKVAGAAPYLEADLQLQTVDSARLRNYLPLSQLNPDSAKWLGEAFAAGTLSKVGLLLRGNLADFPFRQGEGLFELQAEGEGLELNFHPDWPHLYDLKAKALLFGPVLLVDAEAGRLGNVPLQAVHAESSDYAAPGWLGLSGKVRSDLALAMKLLKQTPLRRVPERLSKMAEPSGVFQLELNAVVPMDRNLGAASSAGLLQLENASLAFKGSNLTLQAINGTVGFDENGIVGKGFSAQALDEAILFDIAEENGDLFIDATGKAQAAALRKAFGGDFWKHLEGSFNYHLNAQIPPSLDSSNRSMRIGLSSDLSGLEIKLPSPLVKPVAEKKDFNADISWRRGDHLLLHLAYGHEGRARLLFNDRNGLNFYSGDIAWQKPQPPPNEAAGLGLYVKAAQMDIGAWKASLQAMGGGLLKTFPRAVDIQLDNWVWQGESLGKLWLTGRQEAGELLGEVDSRLLKGFYALSAPGMDNAQLRLDLEQLNLTKLMDWEGQGKIWSAVPSALPGLQVRAKHVLRQQVDWGGLELETEPWTEGLNIRQLSLASENYQASLKGSWLRQEGIDQTKLYGNLRINDLESLLNQLGYGREVYRTPTDAVLSLAWDGSPQQFSLASASGQIKLKLGRGRVLPLPAGYEQGLGMLNLQGISRLLLVDFNDLFGKGLVYDGMEGVLQLGGGQARTKGWWIDAVSAEILAFGRVGLASHDVEQTVSVVSRRAASNPITGAMLDFAQSLMGGESSRPASVNYTVAGNWDNPLIKRIEGNAPPESVNRAWTELKTKPGGFSEE